MALVNEVQTKKRRYDATLCIDELQKAEYMPSLKTVLMVEKAIQEAKEWPNKRQLWLSLPKKIMYQKLLIILDYLEYSRKIVIAKTGEIVWVWDPGFHNRHRDKNLKTF